MSPEAARLFAKIVRIGPSYFDLVLPLHEREIELCDLILKAESAEEASRLTRELLAVGEQIASIGETRQ
jgi:hypothetical protein